MTLALRRKLPALAVLVAAVALVATVERAPASPLVRVVLETTAGDLVLGLDRELAPRHVERIVSLVRLGIEEGVPVCRVEPGFLVQLAEARDRKSPLSPEQLAVLGKIPAEVKGKHVRHALTMARPADDPDGAVSSFSILLGDAPHLDGKFTVFGRLVEARSEETLARILACPRNEEGEPLSPIVVRRAFVVDPRAPGKRAAWIALGLAGLVMLAGRARPLAALLAALVELGGLALALALLPSDAPRVPHVRAPGSVPSNVLPQDYVGPEACRDCHKEQYRLWSEHPHRKMNQNASARSVLGDFSGARIVYQGGEIAFEESGGRFFMSLERGGKLVRRDLVTRTVGTIYAQYYIGRQVAGPEPRDSLLFTRERKLSFGWWVKLRRWMPVLYFDPCGPEYQPDGKPTWDFFSNPPLGPLWSSTCLLCHNTYPYIYRVAIGDGLAGFPSQDLRVAPEVAAIVSERVPVRPGETLHDALDPERHLVTLGVSCEACHFGSREHVETDGDFRHQFLPSSPLVSVEPDRDVAAVRSCAYAVNGLCTQCHGTSNRVYANDACTWNSREGLDLEGGACASAIKCTDCHDPHTKGPRELTDAPRYVESCARCHPKVGSEHGGHEGRASCLDCHMPRVTQGLDEVVRTHRISSPTDERMFASGAWNACNLCHLDKPIEWTAAGIERLFGKKIDAAPWSALYGGRPVGKVWLESRDQAIRLVATQAYARSPLGAAALPDLVRALEDPEAVDRTFAWFAVERVLGRSLGSAYEVTASPAMRKKQVEALLASLRE